MKNFKKILMISAAVIVAACAMAQGGIYTLQYCNSSELDNVNDVSQFLNRHMPEGYYAGGSLSAETGEGRDLFYMNNPIEIWNRNIGYGTFRYYFDIRIDGTWHNDGGVFEFINPQMSEVMISPFPNGYEWESDGGEVLDMSLSIYPEEYDASFFEFTWGDGEVTGPQRSFLTMCTETHTVTGRNACMTVSEQELYVNVSYTYAGAIFVHPDNLEVCYGDTPPEIADNQGFNYGYDCGDLREYFWQRKVAGGSWQAVGTPGINATSYTPAQPIHSNTQFRRGARLTGGSTLYSNTISFTVQQPGGGLIANAEAIQCYNAPYRIESTEDAQTNGCGLTYEWEWSSTGAAGEFETVPGSGNSAGITTPAVTGTKYIVRYAVHDNGERFASNTISITPVLPDAGSVSLADNVRCTGDITGAIASVSSASGPGFTGYQWHESVRGGRYAPIEGATAETLTDQRELPDMGYKSYKRQMVTQCPVPEEMAYTEEVTVDILSPLNRDYIGSAKETYCITEEISPLNLSGSNPGRELSYQWYMKPHTANGYIKCSESDLLSGEGSDRGSAFDPGSMDIRLFNACRGHGGADFICEYTDGSCTERSHEITINVFDQITPGDIDGDRTVCSTDGSMPSITQVLAPTGGDGSYVFMWAYEDEGTGEEIFIEGEERPLLSFDNVIRNSKIYRRYVYDECISPLEIVYSEVTYTYHEISVSIEDTEACEGTIATITAPEGFIAYRWDGIQGGRSHSLNIGASDKSVTLRVTDAYGCSAEDNATIASLAKPRLSMPDIEVCEDQGAEFTAPGGHPVYILDGGEPQESAEFTIPAGEISGGTHTMEAEGANGCMSDISNFAFNVIDTPNIRLSNLEVCRGEAADIDANPYFEYYQWSGPGGLISEGAGAYSIRVRPDTTTRYTLLVTGEGGCTGTAGVTVTVHDNPEIALADTSVCEDGALSLTAPDGYEHYYWSSNNGTDRRSTTIYVSEPIELELTVTDYNGCTGSAAMLAGTYPNPVITSRDFSGCIGDSIEIWPENRYSRYLWGNGETGMTLPIEVQEWPFNEFTLQVWNMWGCTSSGRIQVLPLAVPDGFMPYSTDIGSGLRTYGDQDICTGDEITIEANGEFESYEWSTGGAGKSTDVSFEQDTEMELTVTNENGCSASTQFTVYVHENPVFDIPDTSQCNDGSSISFSAPIEANRYLWSNGFTSMEALYTLTRTQPLWLEASNQHCTYRDSFTVAVMELPEIDIADTSICTGNSVSYALSEGYSSYAWSNGQSGRYFEATPAASRIYTVEVQDTNGCFGQDGFFIEVTEAPSFFIDYEVGGICRGETAELTVSREFESYEWSTGQYTRRIQAQPEYDSVFTVTVLATNGCSISKSITQEVYAPPVPQLRDTAVCEGDYATLSHPGRYEIAWSTGASGNNILFRPSGDVTVHAVITDGNGCSAEDSMRVSVNRVPRENLQAQEICHGDTASISLSGEYASCEWSTGDTAHSIAVSPAQTEIYYAEYTDFNGCSGRSDVQVSVLEQYLFTLQSRDICRGDAALLTAPLGFASYEWSTGSRSNTAETAPDSTIEVSLTVTDAFGCSAHKTATVTVTQLPEIHIEDIYICEGEYTAVTAPQGNYTYIWSNGSTSRNTIFNYGDSGEHELAVIERGSYCENADTFMVVSVQRPSLGIQPTVVCEGEPAEVVLPPQYDYTWQDGVRLRERTVYPSPGETFTVTAADSSGCMAVLEVPVSASPMPDIAIGEQNTCQGDSVHLSAPYYEGYAYTWQDGTQGHEASFAPLERTQYFSVTAEGICTATETFRVVLEANRSFTFRGTVLCSEDETKVMEIPDYYETYEWSTGSAETWTSVTSADAGTVSVTVTDAAGCTNVFSAEAVLDTVSINIIADSTAMPGDTITLKADEHEKPGAWYTWHIEDTTMYGYEIAYAFADTGAYDIAVAAETNHLCRDSMMKAGFIEIKLHQEPDTTEPDTTGPDEPDPEDPEDPGDTLGIEGATSSIYAYPVPADDWLYIDARGFTGASPTGKLISIDGKTALTAEIKAGAVTEIDISRIVPGTYILKIDSRKSSAQQKISIR